jgi:hypothetical protein
MFAIPNIGGPAYYNGQMNNTVFTRSCIVFITLASLLPNMGHIHAINGIFSFGHMLVAFYRLITLLKANSRFIHA